MVAAAGANDVLMYVLLGTTQFSSSRGYIEDFRVRQQVSPKEEDVIVVDLATMRRAVSSLVAETCDPDHRRTRRGTRAARIGIAAQASPTPGTRVSGSRTAPAVPTLLTWDRSNID